MITKDNFKEVLNMLTSDDIQKIKSTQKEYIELSLAVFNAGAVLHYKLTNFYDCNSTDPIFDIDSFLDELSIHNIIE